MASAPSRFGNIDTRRAVVQHDPLEHIAAAWPRRTHRNRPPCTGGCSACRTTGRAARRHRHAPAQDLQPVRPVAEVRKGDDRLAPDAQHLADDRSVWRIACSVCDRITQSNDRVVEAGEPAFEVALDHVDPVADAGEHAGVVDLDAVAGRAARLVAGTRAGSRRRSPGRARARRGDPAGDRREVGAGGDSCCGLLDRHRRQRP